MIGRFPSLFRQPRCPTWILLKPRVIRTLVAFGASLPSIFPWQHLTPLKPDPLSFLVQIKVTRLNHILPFKMQRNITLRTTLGATIHKRRSAARATVHIWSFTRHGNNKYFMLGDFSTDYLAHRLRQECLCHKSTAKKLRYMSKFAAIFARNDNTCLSCTQPIANLLTARL